MQSGSKTTNHIAPVFFKTMFERHNAVMLLVDPKTGRIVEANGAASQFYGYPPETLKKMNVSEINTQAVPIIGVAMRKALEEKRNTFNFSHRLAGGEIRRVKVHSSPIDFEGGTLLYSIIYDITDKTRSKKARQESEKKYATLFHNSSDGIVITDDKAFILDVNRAAMEMFGYERDELIGLNASGLMDPEHLKKNPLSLEQLFTEKNVRRERVLLRKDGSVFLGEINAGFAGKRIYAFVRDITERRRFENALRLSQRKFRSVLDNLQALIFVADMNTYRLLYVNNTFREVFGEHTGKLCWKVIQQGQDGPCSFCNNAMLLDSRGKPAGIRVREMRNTRNGRWYECVDTAISWSDDAYVRMEVATDITERREAERKLEEQYIINQAQAEIARAIVNPDSGIESVSAVVNNYARIITGSAQSYVATVDRNTRSMIVHSHSTEAWICHVRNRNPVFPMGRNGYDGLWGRSLSTRKPFFTNNPESHPDAKGLPDGHLPIRRLLSVPVIYDGELVGQITVANSESDYGEQDIKKLISLADLYSMAIFRMRSIADMARARSEAEEASKAKSAFLAKMSHEVRTPLNAVINLIGLVLQSDLTHEQKDYLSTAESSSRYLLEIINDILDISKIEAGGMKLVAQNFDLYDLLKSIFGSFKTLAAQKKLEFKLRIDPLVPRIAFGDWNCLRQIINNLIGNALKFTEKGSIVLSVRSEEMQTPEADGRQSFRLWMQVADSGIGIDKDALDKIFERFKQADDSMTRRYGGTGLGLAITRQLTEMMGGSVGVVSEKNQGSTFTFNVVLKHGDHESLVCVHKGSDLPDAARLSRLPALTILVVEDNPPNRKVAEAVFKKLGQKPLIVNDGQSAIEALRKNNYDVVFMDLEMPVMDGLEATRRIRSGEAGEEAQKTAIMAMTAHAVNGYAELCFNAGMDGFIAKPLSMGEISQTLAKLSGKAENVVPCKEEISKKGYPALPILDKESAIARLGDETFYQEVVSSLLINYNDYLNNVRDLYRRKKYGDLRLAVHTMKGHFATIGAERLRNLSAQLEEDVRSENLGDFEMKLRLIRKELTLVEKQIETCYPNLLLISDVIKNNGGN